MEKHDMFPSHDGMPNVMGLEEAIADFADVLKSLSIEEFWDAYFNNVKFMIGEATSISNPLLGSNIATAYWLESERFWFEVLAIVNGGGSTIELVHKASEGCAPDISSLVEEGTYRMG